MLIPVILLFLQAQYWPGEAGVAKRMSPTKNAKIIGGYDIDITEAPYQVAIFVADRFGGGGTLISEVIVLSSAGAFWRRDPSEYKIRAGSSIIDDGGKIYEVEKLVTHPLNHFVTHNIGLAKLSTPVTFSDTVAAIPMIKQGEEVDDGENVQVTGWGRTKNNDWPIMLQRTEVQTVNIDICVYEYDPFIITSRMICAGVADGTKGFNGYDDGGPLVYKGEIVGIANYLVAHNGKLSPTQAYTKVSAFRNWIDETIQNVTSHF